MPAHTIAGVAAHKAVLQDRRKRGPPRNHQQNILQAGSPSTFRAMVVLIHLAPVASIAGIKMFLTDLALSSSLKWCCRKSEVERSNKVSALLYIALCSSMRCLCRTRSDACLAPSTERNVRGGKQLCVDSICFCRTPRPSHLLHGFGEVSDAAFLVEHQRILHQISFKEDMIHDVQEHSSTSTMQARDEGAVAPR